MRQLTLPGFEIERLGIVVKRQVVKCDDPYHNHNSPIQYVVGIKYKGHYIEITKDGDVYNVRVDNGIAKLGVVRGEVDKYIKEQI